MVGSLGDTSMQVNVFVELSRKFHPRRVIDSSHTRALSRQRPRIPNQNGTGFVHPTEDGGKHPQQEESTTKVRPWYCIYIFVLAYFLKQVETLLWYCLVGQAYL